MQAVVTAISDAQSAAGGGPAGIVDLGPGGGKLQLDRVIPLAGVTACSWHMHAACGWRKLWKAYSTILFCAYCVPYLAVSTR